MAPLASTSEDLGSDLETSTGVELYLYLEMCVEISHCPLGGDRDFLNTLSLSALFQYKM